MDEETDGGVENGHHGGAAEDGEDEEDKNKGAVTVHNYLILIG